MPQPSRRLALAGAIAGLAATVLAPTAAQAAVPRPVYASGIPRPVYASGWSPAGIREASGVFDTSTCRSTGDCA